MSQCENKTPYKKPLTKRTVLQITDVALFTNN